MNSKIKIFFDPNNLLKIFEENTLIYESVSDYVEAYYKITNSIFEDKNLNIIIRNKTSFNWLSKLESVYENDILTITNITAKEVLKQKWKIETIDELITDKDIFESGLMDIDLSMLPSSTFEDKILEYFFSRFLIEKEPPIYSFADLLEDLKNKKVNLINKESIIYKQFLKKINTWIFNDKYKELIKIFELLKENYLELYTILGKYKLIKNYPTEVGQNVLVDFNQIFKKFEIDLKNVKVIQEEFIIKEIKLYLNNKVEVGNLEDLNILINMFSGEISFEFDFLYESIKKLKLSVDEDLLLKIINKFKPIYNKIKNKLRLLELLNPAKIPMQPEDNWGEEEWINWAVNEYLPFKFWLEEENSELSSDIASYGRQFGDWIYNNFLRLKNSYKNIVFKIAPEICREISDDSSKIVLFIIIDNFNLKFFKILEKLFSENGFYNLSLKNYLTLIPTETNVCKKSLVSGEFEVSNLANRSYKDIIEKDWPKYLGENKLFYLPNLGSLSEIETLQYQLYFLNFTEIDTILHKDQDDLGNSHFFEVEKSLDKLTGKILDFVEKLKIENNFSICICSDHGSTKINPELPNNINEKYFNNKDFDRFHRFVSISDEKMSILPSQVTENCYVLNRKEFGVNENYLIAKGYNRFIETNGKFYVHGGITPEEIIVPFATFSKAKLKFKELRVKFLNKDYRYSIKSIIGLEISNLNEILLSNIKIEIKNSNISSEVYLLEKILPEKIVTIEIPAIFKKTIDRKESNFLIINITYSLMNKFYIKEIEEKIVMKSFYEEKTNLDDIFNS